MPSGDGTGPMGMGPMTGRAAGYCAGYPVPGYMNPAPGWRRRHWGGRGWGRGFGRGWRHWHHAAGFPGWTPPTWVPTYPPYASPGVAADAAPQAELEALRSQAEYFAGTLEEIRKRIAELEEASKEKDE